MNLESLNSYLSVLVPLNIKSVTMNKVQVSINWQLYVSSEIYKVYLAIIKISLQKVIDWDIRLTKVNQLYLTDIFTAYLRYILPAVNKKYKVSLDWKEFKWTSKLFDILPHYQYIYNILGTEDNDLTALSTWLRLISQEWNYLN